jgi:hypothetical protein
MSTAKRPKLLTRFCMGSIFVIYGLAVMWLGFVIATAKPAERFPYYLIGVPLGLVVGALLWHAIRRRKDESSSKPPSEKPRIYTKHPPDADFPYHS